MNPIYRINRNTFEIEWSFIRNSAWFRGIVVLSGNYLYTGNYSGTVIAINKYTGETVWEYQTEGDAPILNCIAVADDKLFVGNYGGHLYCFEEE